MEKIRVTATKRKFMLVIQQAAPRSNRSQNISKKVQRGQNISCCYNRAGSWRGNSDFSTLKVQCRWDKYLLCWVYSRYTLSDSRCINERTKVISGGVSTGWFSFLYNPFGTTAWQPWGPGSNSSSLKHLEQAWLTLLSTETCHMKTIAQQ